MRCGRVILTLWLPLCASSCTTRDQPVTHEHAATAGRTLDSRSAAPAAPSSGPSASQSASSYIDDRRCAECHGELWGSYQKLGMSRSLSPFDASTAIEAFDDERSEFYHAPSRMHFQMRVRDGRMVVRRYRQRSDGTRINDREQEVDWVIGSGHHVRGYLYGNATGELFEIPIVWYTQEHAWGMAPGYDLAEHQDFDRPITRQCLGCHNAYPARIAGDDSFGTAPLFPRELPHGIGCQRCHGPGARHVELAVEADADLAAIRTSIVNPAELRADRRDAICLQCHLQPMSRRTSIVGCTGVGDYAFAAGDALSEHVLYLELDEQTEQADRFEINHHAYRLFQSQCFRASGDRLHCLTCHDPHAQVEMDDRAAHYRQRCLTCHARSECLDLQGQDADADCVACHMPRRRTQDVVHVVMTDHKIARRSQLAAPTAEIAEAEIANDLPIRSYVWRGATEESEATRRARMIAKLRDHDPTLVSTLTWPHVVADEPSAAARLELGIELAQAQLVVGRAESAVQTLKGLISAGHDAACIHANLGTALVILRRYEQAIVQLEAALNKEPHRPETHYNLGLALAKLNRTSQAEDRYREAIRLRPTYAKAHFSLGNVLAKAGKFDEAAESFQRVLALKPDFQPAYKNLSAVFSRQRKWSEARQVLEDATPSN